MGQDLAIDGGGIERPPRMTFVETADLNIAPESLRRMGSVLDINEALPGLVQGEATALILDINNLYRRADHNDWRVDYSRLKSIFETRCDLRYCAAFSAVDRNNQKSLGWAQYMVDRGYHVVTKDLKRYTSREDGKQVAKGNMDVEITMAVMKLNPAFAHVIIGSCDGDFAPLVEELRSDPFRKVSVLGMTNESYTGMSENLIRVANNFYNLTDIKEHVRYEGGSRDGR